MCGIIGALYRKSSQQDRKARQLLLDKMTLSVAHRGPDAKSYYSDEYCYLGFTRLAFVGGPTSMQPYIMSQNQFFSYVMEKFIIIKS